MAPSNTNIVVVDNDDMGFRNANGEGFEYDDNNFGVHENDSVANDKGRDSSFNL